MVHWNQRSRDGYGVVSNTPGFRPHTTSAFSLACLAQLDRLTSCLCAMAERTGYF
jgi:hypothetical protein